MIDGKKEYCGTSEYLAPEIITGFNYGTHTDMWSFGILIFEMLVGKVHHQHLNKSLKNCNYIYRHLLQTNQAKSRRKKFLNNQ